MRESTSESDSDAPGNERPTPPADLEASVATALEDLATRDPEQLAAVAAYAEELASWVASGGRSTADGSSSAETAERPADSSDDDGGTEGAADDYPEGVPERATVTVTEIDGTKYRYYQWRDGDEIRSKTVEV